MNKNYYFYIFILFGINLYAQTNIGSIEKLKGNWQITNIRGFMTDTLVLEKTVKVTRSRKIEIVFYENGVIEKITKRPNYNDSQMLTHKDSGNWSMDYSKKILQTTIPILGIRKKHKIVQLTDNKFVIVQLE